MLRCKLIYGRRTHLRIMSSFWARRFEMLVCIDCWRFFVKIKDAVRIRQPLVQHVQSAADALDMAFAILSLPDCFQAQQFLLVY